MNRRNFFSMLAAPLVAAILPKPKPTLTFSVEELMDAIYLAHQQTWIRLANEMDGAVMEMMVYGTGYLRIEDVQEKPPVEIGSDFTRVKVVDVWPRENPCLYFSKYATFAPVDWTEVRFVNIMSPDGSVKQVPINSRLEST